MDRKPNKWLKGLAASSLAVGAFFALASPAWANTVNGVNGLKFDGNGLTDGQVNNTGGTGSTINSGAGNVSVSGNVTGNSTITLAKGYAGTLTFNGVTTSSSFTLNVTVSNSAANLAFSGTNNINVGSSNGFFSTEPDVPVNIDVISGTTTISGNPPKSILGVGIQDGSGDAEDGAKSGSLTITGDGTLTLQNGGNDGAIWVNSPAASGATQSAGDINITGNVTVNADGGWSATANQESVGGFGVQSNADFTVGSGATLVANGGQGSAGIFIQNGTANFEGTVTSTGGGLGAGNSGGKYVTGHGIQVGGTKTTTSATLKNSGTLTVTGGTATTSFAGTGTVGAGLMAETGKNQPVNIELGGTVVATGGGYEKGNNPGGNGMTFESGATVTLNGNITATGGGNGGNGIMSGGNGIWAQTNFTIKGGTLAATGGPDVLSNPGYGILVSGTNAGITVENGTVTASPSPWATNKGNESELSARNNEAAGVGLVGTNLRILGGEVIATGSNSTGANVPGLCGINANGANIVVTGGSLEATGGDGPTASNENGSASLTASGIWVTTGNEAAQTSTLSVENYGGTAGSGPTVTVRAGETTGNGSRNQVRAISPVNNYNGSNGVTNTLQVTLLDGVSQSHTGDVFYPWLALSGEKEVANTVVGFAGMTMPQDGLSLTEPGSTNGSGLQHVIVIEPAPLSELNGNYASSYATTGTSINPQSDATYTANFDGPEGTLEDMALPEGSITFPTNTEITVEPEGNGTVKSGVVTISDNATGLTTTVNVGAPASVTKLYPEITTVSGDIPMTYPVTLNGNGGTFPLYTSNDTNSIRPSNFTEVTLYTQPGTGKLLPYGVSNVGQSGVVYSMAGWAALGTLGGGPYTYTMEQLQAVLGALPEATTTNQETPYFQGWFTEATGGDAAAQPFDTTQTIYAQFGATPPATEPGEVTIYRLYNPYSYEHLYTAEVNEYNTLVDAGWDDEGTAWIAPDESDTPVYRLFNRYNQDHYYCTSQEEADYLVGLDPNGWKYDFGGSAAFYSAPQTEDPIYQLFNPFEQTNTHLWTGDFNEYTVSQERGWKGEGPAWYALSLS